MKISDLSIKEQAVLDEAPAGMLGQLGRRVGAGIAGAVGMKNTAANLTGKADVGKTANDVYTKFNQYLGTQQKNIKTATGDDLSNFLQNTYNYNQAKVPQGVLNKQQAYDVITQMAKDGYAQMKGGGADTGATGKDAQGQPQQNKQQAQQRTQGQTQQGVQGQQSSASAKAAAIPPNVQKQLDSLTPTEKKALAGMLS